MNRIDSNINYTIQNFFDKQTSTLSYVVHCNLKKKCAVIDSVLDFDYSSGSIDYLNANKIISYINKNELELEWLIETHVHADHLSASPYIQKRLGGKIGCYKMEFWKMFEIDDIADLKLCTAIMNEFVELKGTNND